ncbi:MAG: hypothetical protein B7Z37_16885 [Verrucomicrobia bacterium 12-59-8]|nr:MAG: hypothetical protein B7Z37_16885 [Verrucomicrobia bacterium 12-59-8]
MNIELSPRRQAVLEREAATRSTPATPTSAGDLVELLLNNACDSYAAAHAVADKSAMAANERLMALGTAVMAQPDRLDAVEAAVNQVLQS